MSAGDQGGAATLQTLRTVAHALRGWPTPLGVAVSHGRGLDADGSPESDRLVFQLRVMLGQVLTLATVHRGRAARRAAKERERAAAAGSAG